MKTNKLKINKKLIKVTAKTNFAYFLTFAFLTSQAAGEPPNATSPTPIAPIAQSGEGLGSADPSSIQSVPGNTYYVSPSGNDANDGLSPESAWRTIGRVNAVTYRPGDSIFFEGGQTFEGSLQFSPANVEPGDGNLITLSSYGEGRATIRSKADEGGLAVYNLGNFRVSNLNFTGKSDASTLCGEDSKGIGILFHNISGNTLSQIEIENVDVTEYCVGIGVVTLPGGHYHDVKFHRVKVHHNEGLGIIAYGLEYDSLRGKYSLSNVQLVGSKINHNRAGVIFHGINNALIKDNEASDNSTRAASGSGLGGFEIYGDRATITGNKAFRNDTHEELRTDGYGFDIAGLHHLVANNVAAGNGGMCFEINSTDSTTAPSGQILIFNNYCIGNGIRRTGEGQIWIGGAGPPKEAPHILKGVLFLNNTVYGNAPNNPILKVVNSQDYRVEEVVFINNIFMAGQEHRGSLIDVANPNLDPNGYTASFYQNGYWGAEPDGSFRVQWGGNTYGGLAEWVRDTWQEQDVNGRVVGLNVNPGFCNAAGGGSFSPVPQAGLSPNDLKLAPSSPLIDSGPDLGESSDFFGNRRPAGFSYDMGAHEWHPTEACE